VNGVQKCALQISAAGGPRTTAGGGGSTAGGAGSGGRTGVGVGGRASPTTGAAGADGLHPEALLLETKEKDAMLLLSKVIGRTPRTLKRFVNVYRIIRAGLRGEKLAAFRGAGDEDGHYRAVLVLLSVAHGAPDLAPHFFRVLEEWHQKQPAEARKVVGLKDFLSHASRPPGEDPEAESPGAGEAGPPGFSPLLGELKKFADHYREDIPVAVLREWLPVVVRYTFQLGRMSEEFEAVGPA
jgi:hypothetical protein